MKIISHHLNLAAYNFRNIKKCSLSVAFHNVVFIQKICLLSEGGDENRTSRLRISYALLCSSPSLLQLVFSSLFCFYDRKEERVCLDHSFGLSLFPAGTYTRTYTLTSLSASASNERKII